MLDDLCNKQGDRDSVHSIVQRLADARLVTTSTNNGHETVEIIHDSLIREWVRLQRWLNKDRSFLSWERELERDALEWKDTSPDNADKRDEGRLLRGLQLGEAERWLEERKDDLSEAEIEFIHASKQSLLKRNRIAKVQWVIFALVVLFIFMLAIQLSGQNGKISAILSEKEYQVSQVRYLSAQVDDLQGKLDSRVIENNNLRDRLKSMTIRGTVAEDSFTWTPQNFAGFYYDINQDLGTETLATNLTMGEIAKELSGDAPYGITYTTTAQNKIFERDLWGSYKVIGFLGEKYFAGYNKGVDDGSSIFYMMSIDNNTLYKHQLEKILMDGKDEMTFASGAPLMLKEGYELTIKTIDPGGNKVYVELSKNGSVVDSKVVTPSKDGAT
jgi:hypothetical protein